MTLDLLIRKAPSDVPRWIARHDIVRLDVFRDDRAGCNNCSSANFYTAQDHGSKADPDVIADVDGIYRMTC